MIQIPPVNRLTLLASIVERDALRYTPAGIPMVAGRVSHASKQMEAGIERMVELEISVIAAGEIAGRLNAAELGGQYLFSGFLSRKSRNSRTLVYHITDFGNIT